MSEVSNVERTQANNVLDEAHFIINGARRTAYGSAKESFDAIAKTWSAVLKIKVTPEQVALCMVGLKVCREAHSHSRDNLVDICGYAALADELAEND